MKVEELVANIARNVLNREVTLEMCSEIFILSKHFEAFKLSAAQKEP